MGYPQGRARMLPRCVIWIPLGAKSGPFSQAKQAKEHMAPGPCHTTLNANRRVEGVIRLSLVAVLAAFDEDRRELFL